MTGRNLPAPTDGEVYKVCISQLVDLLVQESWIEMKKGVRPSDIWDMIRKRAATLLHKKVTNDILNEIRNRPNTKGA